jgi:hypothetical protein
MRRFLFVILFIPLFSLTQSSVKVNYNTVYVGKSLSADFDYEIDKFIFSVGLAYFPGINKDQVSFNTFYKDRGSPTNFIQHFGIQFGGGYKIYENRHFELFGLYKGCLASMDTYFKFFQNYTALVPEPQDIEDYAVTVNTDEFGPLFSFDNTLGILFKGNLTNNLFLNLHGGVGFTYIKNKDQFTITPSNTGSSLLSTTISIGFGYTFMNSKNNIE